MPWSTSSRRQELPRDWAQIRRRVLRRDHYQCQQPGCNDQATDVDHVSDPDDHDDANLQSLCADHHRAKTLNEAQAAMAATRARARHPREQHPGLRR
ncbi:MAG: hypothetical protein JWO67_765 [Streptosporangiaceae bacterium]|nr:hypothetical protein [Streptosporangiaceae bacterium]